MRLPLRWPQAYMLSSAAALIINYYLRSPIPGWIAGSGVAVIFTIWAWMVVGIVTVSRRHTAGWYLLTASAGCFIAGGTFNFIWASLHHGSFPFPGPADVPFVLQYPLGIAGLLAFARGREPRDARRVLGYGILIAAVIGEAFTWPSLWAPVIDAHISNWTKALTLTYPALDLFTLAAAVALFLCLRVPYSSARERPASVPVLIMLIAGAAALLLADTLFTYASLRWSWDQPSLADAGWFAWLAMWSLAALEPDKEA